MADMQDSPPRGASREQRLADALRANLKRRKAQARGRAEPVAACPVGIVQDAPDGGSHGPAGRRGDAGGN
ncbi:hypothetical protein DU475_02625 [Rhodopseudomonas sp. WA056]|uniref:hypothetical protein n=1 Tax=Rhodopseudomonas sp. WA056 TaxID=2269367 RepID=UPI0009B9F5C3|nr:MULTISPECIES: hypothetical protein [Rhodopseudomonas]NEW86156.1 hypothetical protein [Rhodopseudomonas sp. WA056]